MYPRIFSFWHLGNGNGKIFLLKLLFKPREPAFLRISIPAMNDEHAFLHTFRAAPLAAQHSVLSVCVVRNQSVLPPHRRGEKSPCLSQTSDVARDCRWPVRTVALP